MQKNANDPKDRQRFPKEIIFLYSKTHQAAFVFPQ